MYTPWDIDETGPVRDAQQTKQCVCNIPCDCDQISKPLDVHVKEHKYNMS
jgi:hypothetical protein